MKPVQQSPLLRWLRRLDLVLAAWVLAAAAFLLGGSMIASASEVFEPTLCGDLPGFQIESTCEGTLGGAEVAAFFLLSLGAIAALVSLVLALTRGPTKH